MHKRTSESWEESILGNQSPVFSNYYYTKLKKNALVESAPSPSQGLAGEPTLCQMEVKFHH